MERQCVTNGAATQLLPIQPQRDGEWAQPLKKSRDGDGWRSGSQGGKSLEYRNDTPRISDIYAIRKWLKHMQCITCNIGGSDDSFLYRKVIAEIDRR